MKVNEVMHRSIVACSASDSLHRAANLMWDHDVGALPVVDDEGKVVGIITDRDMCMAAYTTGLPLGTIHVDSAMAHSVFTCRAADSVAEAESLMRAHQVRRVPVVDEQNRPIGMLSLNDLARHASDSRWYEREGHQLVHTLAAICEPRKTPAAIASA